MSTMKECCVRILERLYSDHPDEFTKWAFAKDNGFKSRFSTTDKDSFIRLGPSIFVNLSLSNHDKFSLLSQMLRELDLNGSTIKIQYRQKMKNDRRPAEGASVKVRTTNCDADRSPESNPCILKAS